MILMFASGPHPGPSSPAVSERMRRASSLAGLDTSVELRVWAEDKADLTRGRDMNHRFVQDG